MRAPRRPLRVWPQRPRAALSLPRPAVQQQDGPPRGRCPAGAAGPLTGGAAAARYVYGAPEKQEPVTRTLARAGVRLHGADVPLPLPAGPGPGSPPPPRLVQGMGSPLVSAPTNPGCAHAFLMMEGLPALHGRQGQGCHCALHQAVKATLAPWLPPRSSCPGGEPPSVSLIASQGGAVRARASRDRGPRAPSAAAVGAAAWRPRWARCA